MNSRTLAFDERGSLAAPTNSTPRSRYSAYAFTNSGISPRQGAHQVAQKLTTTTLPLSCENWRRAPGMSLNTSFGDGARCSCGTHTSPRAAIADGENPAASAKPITDNERSNPMTSD
jgi:hypothetical protein